MFTGIIQGLAVVEKISRTKGNGSSAELVLNLGNLSNNLKIGDSVSINGACLTVVTIEKKRAKFQMVDETMHRTALGHLRVEDKVNIERSLRLGESMDGHFVLGHIDGIGRIVDKQEDKEQTTMWISVDKELFHYIAPKGSIACDGVSLTVVDVKNNKFSVALIPHTLRTTTLGIKGKGEYVNIEVDILARYVRKAVED